LAAKIRVLPSGLLLPSGRRPDRTGSAGNELELDDIVLGYLDDLAAPANYVKNPARPGLLLYAHEHPGYLAEGVLMVAGYPEEDRDSLPEVGCADGGALAY